jgi:hypothetical protein
MMTNQPKATLKIKHEFINAGEAWKQCQLCGETNPLDDYCPTVIALEDLEIVHINEKKDSNVDAYIPDRISINTSFGFHDVTITKKAND